jgi:hypothetical protein
MLGLKGKNLKNVTHTHISVCCAHTTIQAAAYVCGACLEFENQNHALI